jgi:ribosomal protein S18 acetylase RimI-like enzyme
MTTTNTAFTIRLGRPEDAEQLARFSERAFLETFGPVNQAEDVVAHVAKKFSPRLQHAELTNSRMRILLAMSGEELIGYAQFRWVEAPECVQRTNPIELERFYIAGAWHGKGAAAALMEEGVAQVKIDGADAVWLSVWEENPRAIAFYTKLGFEKAGRAYFWLGSDRQNDHIMVRSIGASR